MLKSINYKKYIKCLASFVKIHEDKKKGNRTTDIPPLIRSDWAKILETQKALTINKKTRKKKIRTRKHSTGDKTLDKLARGYLIIKNAVMDNKPLMKKVNDHLLLHGHKEVQVNYAFLDH